MQSGDIAIELRVRVSSRRHQHCFGQIACAALFGFPKGYSGKTYMSGELYLDVGKPMSETTVKIDDKGRVMIPKKIRKTAKVKAGTYVNIKAKDTTIIIEPAESIAEKYCGIFQITKWPEDLDEFIVEATRKWWTNHTT